MLGTTEASPDAPGRSWGGGMFAAGTAGLIAAEFYFAFVAEVRAPIHLQLGMLMLFLSALPSLLWAKRGRASLPVFETLILTTSNTYAIPLLTGQQDLMTYVPEDVTTAAFAVIVFQLVAIVVYEFTRGRPLTHAFWREEVISQDLGRLLTGGLILNTSYVIVSTFTDWVPPSAESVLRAVFFGLGIICTFITSRRLGSGLLSHGERVFFILNLVVQCIVMMATLFLVGAVSLLLLALVGYVSSSGKLPIFAAAAALLSLAVLHNGKAAMRAKYWEVERICPPITQLPEFYSEWIRCGLDFKQDAATGSKVTRKLIERTSLFQMVCLVVSTTPSQQPYLEGDTYEDIPAQFVPRPLWSGKPLGHVSNSKLSVYYGLQTEEGTQTTTIGFGMVAEAFANFGFAGVAGIGALLAFAIKKVQCWASESPLFSYGGLIVVILLAWSFQVEFTLSIWLASFYQACLAAIFLPFTLRKIAG